MNGLVRIEALCRWSTAPEISRPGVQALLAKVNDRRAESFTSCQSTVGQHDTDRARQSVRVFVENKTCCCVDATSKSFPSGRQLLCHNWIRLSSQTLQMRRQFYQTGGKAQVIILSWEREERLARQAGWGREPHCCFCLQGR